MKKQPKKKSKNSSFFPRGFLAAAFLAVFAFAGFFAWEKLDHKYPWLKGYMADQSRTKPVTVQGPKHILFSYVDHFEPHDLETMNRWMKSYPATAEKHRDADGRHPQHTNFWYNGNLKDKDIAVILRQLSELSYRGFGETELHLHHWDDTEATLTKKMFHAIELSQQSGAMITAEAKPRTAFGFVHGRWSLDNSRGKGDCGVNNEITVLRKLGCYGDFTHPSWGIMTPRTVNRFYYVTDDPEKPKSYDFGPEMEVGKPGLGDLLILEGPTVVHWKGLKPRYDGGDITHTDLPTPERIKKWIETDIHVKGRPEWVFVRIYTHGVVPEDHEVVLGKWAEDMYSYLEKNYNDGRKYVLHYVTSRETYNIAKAAEAGKSGNPKDYRDYEIAPYVQNYFTASVPFETRSFDNDSAVFQFLVPAGTLVKARLKGVEVKGTGHGTDFRFIPKEGETEIEFKTTEKGLVGFSFKRPPKA
jgi:hypothetical protein